MIIYNYYFAIIILAIIFFLISTKSISILISIIIIIIIGYYYFNKIDDFQKTIENNFNNKIKLINTDINDNELFNDSNYFLNKFPVNIKYLKYDNYLIELLLNIRFIKIFDNAKYIYLIGSIEKFMKLYIFMLGDRYDINIHFTSFLSLRTSIIKELYSIYIIIPNKFIYIYKINLFEELKKTIYNFISHSRKMIITIQNYAFKEKNIKYLEDTKYKPYNIANNITEVF
jgi:hypothetical protein